MVPGAGYSPSLEQWTKFSPSCFHAKAFMVNAASHGAAHGSLGNLAPVQSNDPFRPLRLVFPNLPSLLTIKDVAKVLNVSVRTVHTVKKQIGYVKVRGSLRFLPAAVGDYLDKRKVKPT